MMTLVVVKKCPGGIAQLARAVALQAIGQGFESPYLQIDREAPERRGKIESFEARVSGLRVVL